MIRATSVRYRPGPIRLTCQSSLSEFAFPMKVTSLTNPLYKGVPETPGARHLCLSELSLDCKQWSVLAYFFAT